MIIESLPPSDPSPAPLATLRRRLAGVVLDLAIVALLGAVVWWLESPDGSGAIGHLVTVPYPTVQTVAIPLLYVLAFVVVPASCGRTAGMAVLRMRIRRREDRSPVGAARLVLRGILTYVDALFLGLVGVVAMVTTAHCQRLGDLAADSVVERVGR